MSSGEFHYVRTGGEDPGVDVVDGRAIGVDLEAILKDGLPPFKVALEIIASLCEILDIADQDGEVHGDITPSTIFIDDTGAVSIEGYGIEREPSLAPESSIQGTSTDLFGLGYVSYRLLATRDLTNLPGDEHGHEDAVIDAVIALPWGDMPEEWVGDIQWFLAKLMSFDPSERPTAVDAWRTFVAFADEAAGVSLEDWSPDAIEGGGERRDVAQAVRPAEEASEELGGPTIGAASLKKGAISFGSGSAKSGQATAFWSKDQMKAALEAEEEEEDLPSFKPSVGGGAATSFWTKDQMDAMARGDATAPRPKRKEGSEESSRPKTTFAKKSDPIPPPAQPTPPPTMPPSFSPTAEDATVPPKGRVADAPPPPVAPPPVMPPPIAPPPTINPPPPVAPPPLADDESEGGGGSGMMVIIGAVIALVLLCLVGGGVAAVGAAFLFGEEVEKEEIEKENEPGDITPAQVEPEAPAPAEPEPPAPAEPEPPAPEPEKVAPAPAPKPKPRPKPVASAGPVQVLFNVATDGTLECAGGPAPKATRGGRGRVTFRKIPADGYLCYLKDDGGKPICAGNVMPNVRKCTCPASGDMTCS